VLEAEESRRNGGGEGVYATSFFSFFDNSRRQLVLEEMQHDAENPGMRHVEGDNRKLPCIAQSAGARTMVMKFVVLGCSSGCRSRRRQSNYSRVHQFCFLKVWHSFLITF
jgi:hypothetical protein